MLTNPRKRSRSENLLIPIGSREIINDVLDGILHW